MSTNGNEYIHRGGHTLCVCSYEKDFLSRMYNYRLIIAKSLLDVNE